MFPSGGEPRVTRETRRKWQRKNKNKLNAENYTRQNIYNMYIYTVYKFSFVFFLTSCPWSLAREGSPSEIIRVQRRWFISRLRNQPRLLIYTWGLSNGSSRAVSPKWNYRRWFCCVHIAFVEFFPTTLCPRSVSTVMGKAIYLCTLFNILPYYSGLVPANFFYSGVFLASQIISLWFKT